MPKLTDTQCILLSTAAQRPDLALHPLPASLAPGGGVTRAIAALVKAGHAERRDDAAFATSAGLAAIGVVADEPEAELESASPATSAMGAAGAAARGTKTQAVLTLLDRPGGATMAELIAATGWLPHTTRAALTGLRKKGHAVARDTRDGASCYRIVAAERAAAAEPRA